VENTVSIIVKDSVIVRSSSDIIEGTISLKYIKEATFIIIVNKLVKVARVVIIAVGIR
jgi:branched-subunit amino acid aminotransferase/4-amino-4-deoxychorismate lyase